jgi:hypothetical protein
MKRRSLDILVSITGLCLAALLVVAGGLLTWAHNFVGDQVQSQLSAQKISFPQKGTEGLTALKGADFSAVSQYAGKQLTTGAQAEVFADHYIAVHLKGVGGGKTYSELSGQYQGLTDAQKAAPAGQALNGQVQTMFRGETLRGLLLNAYAFGKMGTIAGIAAVAAFVAALALLVLGALGLWHSRKVPPTAEVFQPHTSPAPVPAKV